MGRDSQSLMFGWEERLGRKKKLGVTHAFCISLYHSVWLERIKEERVVKREIEEKYQTSLVWKGKSLWRENENRWALPPFCFSSIMGRNGEDWYGHSKCTLMPLKIHTYAILILFNEFLVENAKPIFFLQQ